MMKGSYFRSVTHVFPPFLKHTHIHTHTHSRDGLESLNTAGVMNCGVLISVIIHTHTHRSNTQACARVYTIRKIRLVTSPWCASDNTNADGTVTFKPYNSQSTK